MLKLIIEPHSETPIFLQIVEQVREQLSLGAVVAGEQLPTVRSVAGDLKINFNTVSRAYRVLDEAGIISTQQGRGTYLLETKGDVEKALIHAELVDETIVSFLSRMEKLVVSPQQTIDLIRARTEQ